MKSLSFNQTVWTGALLAVGYLIATPSIMDAWAQTRWKQVPCHLGTDNRYFYEFNGIQYASTRRDFWQLSYTNEKTAQGMEDFIQNDSCWVNPKEPLDAVLRADSHKNWSNSPPRLIAAGFLIVCVWGVLHFGVKRRMNV